MKKHLVLISAVALAFASCVPKRSLTMTQNHVKGLQTDSISTHSKLISCNSDVESLEKTLTRYNIQLDSLGRYQGKLQDSINRISSNYESKAILSDMTIE